MANNKDAVGEILKENAIPSVPFERIVKITLDSNGQYLLRLPQLFSGELGLKVEKITKAKIKMLSKGEKRIEVSFLKDG